MYRSIGRLQSINFQRGDAILLNGNPPYTLNTKILIQPGVFPPSLPSKKSTISHSENKLKMISFKQKTSIKIKNHHQTPKKKSTSFKKNTEHQKVPKFGKHYRSALFYFLVLCCYYAFHFSN